MINYISSGGLITINYFHQAASEYVMFCALENNIKHESGKVYRFRKHFRQANRKLDDKLANGLWERSVELVRLNERLAKFEATK